MDMYFRLSYFLIFLFCISVSCSAVVIEPGKDGDGYSWSGSTLTITGASEEYTLSNAISNSITIHVDVQEVTLDGNGVSITGIRGQPTLDLRNVHVDGGILQKSQHYDDIYGITECRNIENSVIVVRRTTTASRADPTYGIGKLYGNLRKPMKSMA